MSTLRDLLVVEFIREYKVAQTSTLTELFYKSKRVAQRRLSELVEHGDLKRSKNGLTSEYLYYIKTPPNLMHALALTDLLRELSKKVDLRTYQREFQCGNVRSDCLVTYDAEGKTHNAFIEIQLSGRPNLDKYAQLRRGNAWKEQFQEFPEIIIMTDAHFNSLGLDVAVIGTDLAFKGEIN